MASYTLYAASRTPPAGSLTATRRYVHGLVILAIFYLAAPLSHAGPEKASKLQIPKASPRILSSSTGHLALNRSVECWIAPENVSSCLHFASAAQNNLSNSSSDVPADWSVIVCVTVCGTCLQANSDCVSSSNRSPICTRADELVNWNAFLVFIPDLFKCEQIMLSFHNHYTRVHKPYLIKSESDTPFIIGRYFGWCRATETRMLDAYTLTTPRHLSAARLAHSSPNTATISPQYLGTSLVKRMSASVNGAL